MSASEELTATPTNIISNIRLIYITVTAGDDVGDEGDE